LLGGVLNRLLNDFRSFLSLKKKGWLRGWLRWFLHRQRRFLEGGEVQEEQTGVILIGLLRGWDRSRLRTRWHALNGCLGLLDGVLGKELVEYHEILLKFINWGLLDGVTELRGIWGTIGVGGGTCMLNPIDMIIHASKIS
jgi:hypothetical protein